MEEKEIVEKYCLIGIDIGRTERRINHLKERRDNIDKSIMPKLIEKYNKLSEIIKERPYSDENNYYEDTKHTLSQIKYSIEECKKEKDKIDKSIPQLENDLNSVTEEHNKLLEVVREIAKRHSDDKNYYYNITKSIIERETSLSE